MSVYGKDYFEGGPVLGKCSACKKTLDKWINTTYTGDLCPDCAQHCMRILFEDLIEYHNDVHISLLGIIRHGRHDERNKPNWFKKEDDS